MSRELDAAIGAAHEMTRQPEVRQAVNAATTSAPQKKSPSVVTQAKGHRVRLRDMDHALEGCVSTHGGEDRFSLQPNQWTIVSDDVYTMLKGKFYKPQTFQTVDWNGDVNNPMRQTRSEAYQEYIIEFPEEVE